MKKTSLNSEYRPRYGVAGAGPVSSSLIGSLPNRSRTLGPVCCSSYRVASRIANTLGGGFAVRGARELNKVPVVLFHSPPEHTENLLAVLETGEDNDWAGRTMLICECEMEEHAVERFRKRGASVARVRRFELPGYLVIHGTGAALAAALRVARELQLHPIEVKSGAEAAFDAAVTLGTCALTPLLDAVTRLLRNAGVRETDAPRLAAALFQKTAREYDRSGKQSWGWYTKSPDASVLMETITGAGPDAGPVLRQLILLGMATFGKHAGIAAALK